MKLPTGRSGSCAVETYIGSDFDDVKLVADNIEAISQIGPVAGGLVSIVENLEDLLALAENVEEMQVVETITLEHLQQTVAFEKVIPKYMSLFIIGQSVDSRHLLEGVDYGLQSAISINLTRTYPDGTKLLAIQTIVADKSVSLVYDDRTVFNRSVVMMGTGGVLKDEVRDGEAIQPLLIWKGRQYIPDIPLPIEHVIKDNIVKVMPYGDISIETIAGGSEVTVILNEWNARALPQKEIIFLMQEGMHNILIVPPKEWTLRTRIVSPTYHIKVDGVDYIPAKIPFTTLSTWDEDKKNWLEIRGTAPCVEDLTGKTNIELCEWTANMLISARTSTNITTFSNKERYKRVTLIPDSDNITLVHSDSALRLISKSTLSLSTNSVYEFFIDHDLVPRQVV